MFIPCGHRVIVKRDAVEDTYGESKIIVTTSEAQKKLEAANCQTGVVVAIGPDAWKAFRKLDENGKEVNGQTWAKPGDYVLYAKYAARNLDDPFSPDEKDLVLMNDEDIIAVIVPGEMQIPESEVKKQAEEATR